MKTHYLVASLLSSVTVIANPVDLAYLDSNDVGPYGPVHVTADQPASNSPPSPPPAPSSPQPAPDPPPAGNLFASSTDGELPDGTIINFTPNNPSNQQHSCWTPPKSRPRPTDPISHGLCSVCVVQRNGTDGSADYLLWARDDANNAMGNMGQTTVWPIDGARAPNDVTSASMLMGGSSLLLRPSLSTANHQYTQVNLLWATPSLDPNNATIWFDPSAPQGQFDPSSMNSYGPKCAPAGNAANGAVVYAICFFDCH